MPKVAQRFLEVDPWAVVEKGFHPNRSRASESVFSLGNEYMGVRGYFDEGYGGDSLVGSYFNGVFEEGVIRHPHCYPGMIERSTFIVNTVDWLHTRIRLGKERLDLSHSSVSRFVRRLDLKTGVLAREFIWTTGGGKKLRVKFLRFVSMASPNLGAQRVIFEPLNFSGRVTVQVGLDFRVIHEESGRPEFCEVRKQKFGGGLWAILARTEKSGHRVFSSLRLSSGDRINPAPVDEPNFIGCRFALRLSVGKQTGFDRVVVNYAERRTDRTNRQVWDHGMKLARRLGRTSLDEALSRHEAYWQDVWRTLDVTIEGDEENQQGVRFCIFQLHQTYHGVDPSLNVSAKGLTGEEYWGCTWWDTEAYCLPFYMFNNPAAARNLLAYRYRTLAGAIRRARELDCRGARYPMSTIDGSEDCSVWQHGDLEIHISAAVAYGIWHYDRVCGDSEFLYSKGIEMLLQISRYYASRGEWSPLTGQFGFWGVMGADEFHMMVHNNTYTNVMAKKALEYTLAVMDRMKRDAPDRLERVKRKVRLQKAEPRDWRLKARKMRVLMDPRSGLMEQHDGYFDMPHIDVRTIPPEQLPLYAHWAYVRIFRYDMIKQPDVLLLPFFFSHDYTDREKRANYEYYEPRCSHESSLSPGIHAILASELSKHEEAFKYSLHAARLDLDDYNRNTREGLHTTSMAAAWLNVVYGYGGMRSDGPALSFRPSIPRKWKRFGFRILYRGSVLSVSVDKRNVAMCVPRGEPVEVELFGRRRKVDAEGIRVALPADRVA